MKSKTGKCSFCNSIQLKEKLIQFKDNKYEDRTTIWLICKDGKSCYTTYSRYIRFPSFSTDLKYNKEVLLIRKLDILL